jgi:hypothetical protein
MTISPNGPAYTFSGSVPIGFSNQTTTLSQTAGNNTIATEVRYTSGSSASTMTVNTAAGTNLSIQNMTYSHYGWGGVTKTGTGQVTFTSGFSNAGSLFSGNGFNITAGTVMLEGVAQANGVSGRTGGGNAVGGGGFKVQSGATLAGNGLRNSGASDTGGSLSNVLSGGHLAPGVNPVLSNFGTAGTFTLRGAGGASLIANVSLDTGSELDLDLVNLGSYDSIALTKGAYGRMNFIVGDQAIVNINNGAGSLTPGTYSIVTMVEQLNTLNTNQAALNIDVTGGGFIIGSAPAGYNYQFVNVLGNSGFYNGEIVGIDLIVTDAIPEPASMAILGLGAGALLLRGRRRSR